jgi:GNAT superfamily N-acetyltransferase
VHRPAVSEECQNLLLWASEVEAGADVECLRRLRNGTAWGFSNDNGEITRERQAEWWAEMTAAGDVKAWLYWFGTPEGANALVGFAVLRRTADGRWWSSVGVDGAWSGKGFGGAITADLIRRSEETVWASARVDNVAAQHLHRLSDWEETSRNNRLVWFRTRPHVHLHLAKGEPQ